MTPAFGMDRRDLVILVGDTSRLSAPEETIGGRPDVATALEDMDHRQAGGTGGWLWDVFVVQFAAFLDRFTWRDVVALLPFVFLIMAYEHGIPIPPEFALVGELLAYIDIVAHLLLVCFLSRASTVLYLVRQEASRALGLAGRMMKRHDARHRREGSARNRRRRGSGGQNDDDGGAVFQPLAWA